MATPYRYATCCLTAANPNESWGRFGTILWAAAALGHTPILRLLLEAGAKPTSYDVKLAGFGNHGKAGASCQAGTSAGDGNSDTDGVGGSGAGSIL